MMKSVARTSLVDVPIVLSFSNKGSPAVRPGSRFEIPIVLANVGDAPLNWKSGGAPSLAYRWIGQGGEVVERDGLRTPFPSGLVEAGSRVELDLGGISPETPGNYELQVSLVLEGLHWACDVGSVGWTQRAVNVSPAPPWPTHLKGSRGARALRGAMVASKLERLLEQRSFAMQHEASNEKGENEATGRPVQSNSDSRANVVVKFRTWLRDALGVTGLQTQLGEVVALASRQEEQALELEKQFLLLRGELRVDQESAVARAPNFLEDLANAREKIANHLLPRNVAPRGQGTASQLAKPSRKSRAQGATSRTSVR